MPNGTPEPAPLVVGIDGSKHAARAALRPYCGLYGAALLLNGCIADTRWRRKRFRFRTIDEERCKHAGQNNGGGDAYDPDYACCVTGP